MVSFSDVMAARTVVDRHLPRSPLERAAALSAELNREVLLKIETLRPTRSFKVRGALTFLASLDAAALARGVVTASGGNHGQGVAWAAATLGTTAVVVMPETVAPAIAETCRALGARVLLRGRIYDDTLALAREVERDEGRAFVHPYGDPLVIAGQGTIGLEIREQCPDVDTVVVPIGGGGLICGIALALNEGTTDARRVRVVGVEPEGADGLRRSIAAGAPVTLTSPASVAERLVARSTEPLNVELALRYVDEVVTVPDAAILDAAREHLERHALLVEPAGAASLAALRTGAVGAGERTVLVVSGGNVPPDALRAMVVR